MVLVGTVLLGLVTHTHTVGKDAGKQQQKRLKLIT